MFKVEGGDALAAALNSLPDRVSRPVKIEALLAGGEPIRRMIATTAPIEPGAPDFAANVHLGPVRRPSDADPLEVFVGIGVPKRFFYDWFLEFGTVRMGPQPTYRPAFDTEVPNALGIIGRELWTALAAKGIGRTATVSTPVTSVGRFL